MLKGTVVLLGLASVHAQSVASLFLYGLDPQSLVGSVLSQNGPSTAYQIQCSDPDDDTCGIPNGLQVTIGPSSNVYSYGVPGQLTVVATCTVDGVLSAACTETDSGPAANSPGTTTTQLSAADITLLPVTIIDAASGSDIVPTGLLSDSIVPTALITDSSQPPMPTPDPELAISSAIPGSAPVSGVPVSGAPISGSAASAAASPVPSGSAPAPAASAASSGAPASSGSSASAASPEETVQLSSMSTIASVLITAALPSGGLPTASAGPFSSLANSEASSQASAPTSSQASSQASAQASGAADSNLVAPLGLVVAGLFALL